MTDNRHGGAYDRGSADAYYGRRYNPHYYKGPTYSSELVTNLTEEEEASYRAGWDDQKESGEFKNWG
jgi:hypothetical protein